MPDVLNISIDGQEQVIKLTAEMKRRAEDMTPVMDQIGIYMERSVQKTIRAGGRPSKWPPSIRASEWGGNFKTLNIKGASGLFGSITHQAGKTYVDIGSNLPYAAIQQTGGLIRPRRVKALPVPLNEKARKAQENVQSVREIPNLFYIPSKARGDSLGVLAKSKRKESGSTITATTRYTTKGGKSTQKTGLFEPWFALRTSVKIPARPFMVVQESDIRYIMRNILRFLTEGGN